MRYDDDKYLNNEEDNDFWDDELELSSDDNQTGRKGAAQQSYASESTYSPYHADDEEYHRDGYDEIYNDDDDPDESNRDNEPEDYYSDPEPEPSKKSRRERFFGKDVDEDQGNDYFDSDADSEPAPPKKPKSPKLDPEDPDYWIDDEESPLSGIMPKPGKKWKWQLIALFAILIALAGAWLWFFRPYADNAVKYGYIKNMERRGSLIKTFEGTMIPYKELGDPEPFYFQELRFSVASDSLAAQMKRMMLGCVPVRLEYEVYHTPLPWKGEEKMIIIKADTADPKKILPPEYR